jgi:hypothetical protein
MLNQFQIIGKVSEIKTTQIKVEVSMVHKGEQNQNIIVNISNEHSKRIEKGQMIALRGHIENKDNQMILIGSKIMTLNIKVNQEEVD